MTDMNSFLDDASQDWLREQAAERLARYRETRDIQNTANAIITASLEAKDHNPELQNSIQVEKAGILYRAIVTGHEKRYGTAWGQTPELARRQMEEQIWRQDEYRLEWRED